MTFLSQDSALRRGSYYEATAQRGAPQPPLQGEAACDVAVVGGGLAGVSAALELARQGLKVTLLEAQQLGHGASGRNGGQAIHGLACDQERIEALVGTADARRIWDMSVQALDLIRARIAQHHITCDWQDGWLGVAIGQRRARALRAYGERLRQVYGYDTQHVAAGDLVAHLASPRYASGLLDRRSGHLHPLKYTLGLARAAQGLGAVVHEASPVTRLEPGPQAVLHTPQGRLRARQVLLAGNVYLRGLAPALHARIMPVGTYIVATPPLGAERARALIPCGAAVCDTQFVVDYFRLSADHRLLFGGRGSYTTATPLRLADSMRRRMVAVFPQLADVGVEHAWGGFVDITLNRAPDFGRLPGQANVYYLQGFSGHGVALTGLAGQLVAEAMAGDAGRFDTFARITHRPFPGGPRLRMPALVLGMAWYRLKDALG